MSDSIIRGKWFVMLIMTLVIAVNVEAQQHWPSFRGDQGKGVAEGFATVVNWGLVISAVSRTQQQAILFVFILAMIEITFSGFMVPVENMPPLLQAIARFAPLQHYLIIIRSIMLKGAGLQELLPQVVALAALNVVLGMVSIGIVTRRLE